MQCEDANIINKNGDVVIDSLTVKSANIDCERFISKKVLFSGEVKVKASKSIEIRSIVSYQDALSIISDT